MSSINTHAQTNIKKREKDVGPSEFKKTKEKKKKDSQIDVNGETYQSKGERLDKKPNKPKIYSLIDLV